MTLKNCTKAELLEIIQEASGSIPLISTRV